jgi:hypothetical protein
MAGGEHVTDYFIDPVRSRKLAWTNYIAATSVGDDGTEILLLHDREAGDGAFVYDIPEHEKVGPLPGWIAERIAPAARCRAPTQFGTPCQNLVDEDGHRCYHHEGDR